MKLTIFWRVILAQSLLIALALGVSLYALDKLNWQTQAHASILTRDAACIEEEKRLLKLFLAEMRSAEKYVRLRNRTFYAGYVQGGTDFNTALSAVAAMMETAQERALADKIAELHARYEEELKLAASGKGDREQARTEVTERIIESLNELVRLREGVISGKTAEARDRAAAAARVMGWLTLGGISGAILLAFFHARSIAAPLKKLAREMQRIGRGDFNQVIGFRAPREVSDLAQSFNRMAGELAKLDRLKADFLAHVSHELRTPLTAIREGTALMLEEIPGPINDSQRDILDIVRGHTERLFHHIASILDLSKMEAEMMEYELAPCNPGKIVQSSVEAVELIARGRGVEIEVRIGNNGRDEGRLDESSEADSPQSLGSIPGPVEPEDSLPVLFLDESRIRQVMDNLLGNGLKFTPEGGTIRVEARVRVDEGREGKSWVEVRVSDTGEGIPEEEVESVFERFYQASQSRGKAKQGTGLGLAIARHIIEAHGGKIWAESRSGQGAQFVFILPVPQNE